MKNIINVSPNSTKVRDTVFVELSNCKLELYKDELNGFIEISRDLGLQIRKGDYVEFLDKGQLQPGDIVRTIGIIPDMEDLKPLSGILCIPSLNKAPMARVRWRGTIFEVYEHEMKHTIVIMRPNKAYIMPKDSNKPSDSGRFLGTFDTLDSELSEKELGMKVNICWMKLLGEEKATKREKSDLSRITINATSDFRTPDQIAKLKQEKTLSVYWGSKIIEIYESELNLNLYVSSGEGTGQKHLLIRDDHNGVMGYKPPGVVRRLNVVCGDDTKAGLDVPISSLKRADDTSDLNSTHVAETAQRRQLADFIDGLRDIKEYGTYGSMMQLEKLREVIDSWDLPPVPVEDLIAEHTKGDTESNRSNVPMQEWTDTAIGGNRHSSKFNYPIAGQTYEIYCPTDPVNPGKRDWHVAKVITVIVIKGETVVVYETNWSAQFYTDSHPIGTLKFREPSTD